MTISGDRMLGRVLVTGAAGFLGHAALSKLRGDGLEVEGVDIGVADASRPDALLDCDLTDFDRLDDIIRAGSYQTILHCGGVSGPMVLADRPDLVWRINALGTGNVLEAARRHGVARVVVCSTTDVYRPQGDGMIDETAALEPDSVYGASKIAAEQIALAYHRQEGLDTVALRLAWIYGPGRKTPTDLTMMIEAGARGEELAMAQHALDRTQYFHVDDAVAGLLSAAASQDPKHRVVNISGGRGQSLGDLRDMVRRHYPDLVVRFESASPRRPGPAGIDYGRAEYEFGYRPLVRLTDGIENQVQALAKATPAK